MVSCSTGVRATPDIRATSSSTQRPPELRLWCAAASRPRLGPGHRGDHRPITDGADVRDHATHRAPRRQGGGKVTVQPARSRPGGCGGRCRRGSRRRSSMPLRRNSQRVRGCRTVGRAGSTPTRLGDRDRSQERGRSASGLAAGSNKAARKRAAPTGPRRRRMTRIRSTNDSSIQDRRARAVAASASRPRSQRRRDGIPHRRQGAAAASSA